jgi:Mg2+ and Co2+ transporter CorA
MGIQQLNVLSLLYMLLPKISDSLFAYLEHYEMDIDAARKKVLHVIKMTHKASLPPLKFFEMFAAMMQQLGIDELDASMKIDIENMILMTDDMIQDITMTGDDTTVKDRDEDEDEDDKKKNNKDDKKLTIEYFGTNLTNEVRK